MKEAASWPAASVEKSSGDPPFVRAGKRKPAYRDSNECRLLWGTNASCLMGRSSAAPLPAKLTGE